MNSEIAYWYRVSNLRKTTPGHKGDHSTKTSARPLTSSSSTSNLDKLKIHPLRIPSPLLPPIITFRPSKFHRHQHHPPTTVTHWPRKIISTPPYKLNLSTGLGINPIERNQTFLFHFALLKIAVCSWSRKWSCYFRQH